MKNCLFLILALVLLSPAAYSTDSLTFIKADNPKIIYAPRVDRSDPEAPVFSYPGISIAATFTGNLIYIKIGNISYGKDAEGKDMVNYYSIFLDGKESVVKVENGNHTIKIGENLGEGQHHIKLFKRTEALCGKGIFKGFLLQKGKALVQTKKGLSRKIEFVGNSITCGYGNEGKNQYCHFIPEEENNYLAYGAITARNLNAVYSCVAFSGKGLIQNYDKTTTNTMPILYKRIQPFDTSSYRFTWNPDIVVINLGTNDFAHGNPDSTDFVSAYIDFIHFIKKKNPQAAIFCLLGPMLNDNYPAGNSAKTVCKKYILSAVQAFKSEAVYFYEMTEAGNLGYGCDWHPSLAQHQKNAEELTAFIREKMDW